MMLPATVNFSTTSWRMVSDMAVKRGNRSPVFRIGLASVSDSNAGKIKSNVR